ncbi:benzoate-CoA ligase family protein [Streptomyces roseirectus]|uniref:Benzoate-CoA ligase family protein n=1 Tax=Streptomyces roseirectus TaxID=2768066 RepID=A0A7H0IQ76_9ACTN|nr:benzoate-CoA ligase family protein [Streptomyces roseirectus]QNP74942.1 benzoate-CoA ligase family protein [Streptomyces roseirectus]
MSVSFNAAAYLVDRQAARGLGDRPALIGPRSTLTYADLAARVAVASAGWRALGVRPEERVVIHAADRPETVVALLSLLRMGAVPVPVSTMNTAAELAALVTDCRCRFLLAGSEFCDRVADALRGDHALPDLVGVVVVDDAAVRPSPPVIRIRWEHLMAAGEASPPGDRSPDRTTEDSPALWLYTSGTTGSPKAAMHRHGSIRTVAEHYGRQVLGLHEHDRCFSVAKLFFAYGLGNSCLLPLAAGAAAILDPAPPTPPSIARRLAEDEPTVYFGVPTSYAALLRTPAVPDTAFDGVRLAVSAGEPLPEELHHRIRARFGIDPVNGMGSTEALHIFLSNRPGHCRPGTLGKPVPGYELRIHTGDGTEAPPGEPGVLRVRAPSAASGYWCRPEATATVFQGPWLDTGDLFTQDADGFYVCHGRAGDMIKSGGIWVAPGEVENRLLQHPAVAAACVVALPDTDGLDRPVACVVPASAQPLDPELLIAFCHDALAAYQRPRHILVFTSLPTTGTGKVSRRAVRQEASARLERSQQDGAHVPARTGPVHPTSPTLSGGA